tara:strand:- start:176365 stop:177726 length:1362 start_codon:yes stop_codon:yes gene_type:complete
MTDIFLHNSLSRKREKFEPIDAEHIRLYACGPTVYNFAHIGNARMAVVFDLLTRLLKRSYPKVTYVSNITDVDDKIIKASKDTGRAIEDITTHYTKIYNQDMAALNVNAPDIQPHATDHIGDMIALCEAMIDNGHAYAADGHVLFHVPSFANYGGLSGRSRDDQIAGARVEIASYKKDPADFVLWKPSADDEPGWDSPWGYGRPGWHIECSAMSEVHLGLPFDIHGGGADLKFPHHENEIAQSCCAHNKDNLDGFAKYWVHNGFVTVEGEKMSKSLGNFTLVHDLLEQYDGEVLRFTLLSAHYRQPLDWSEDKLMQSKKTLDGFYSLIEQSGADLEGEVYDDVLTSLCDDLNTPLAFSKLHALAKDKTRSLAQRGADLKATGALLGILQQDPQAWFGRGGDDAAQIDALLLERTQAKESKNWARADEIRVQLTEMGIEIEDTAEGPRWKKINA